MFERERNILKGTLGNVYNILKKYKVILAGGAITSIFTNKPIHDFDMYFRDAGSVKSFYEKEVIQHRLFGSKYLTNRAVTLTLYNSPHIFQMICCGLYESPEDVFKSFDFVLNMGAYDFSTEEFVLHPEFILHNAQRRICINKDTKYPISSLMRIQKYMERGYKMIPSEWYKMAIMLHEVKIDSWDEFEDNLSGLYGDSISVSNRDDNTPFSWEEAMNRVMNIKESDLNSIREQSAQFSSLSSDEQLRLIMSNFDYEVKCTLLATNRGDPTALVKYDILQEESGKIFLQNVDGRYDGLNIADTIASTYPIHVFKVVRKDERDHYVSIPHYEFMFEPGKIVSTRSRSENISVFDVCNLVTDGVRKINDRISNVILHLQINSPDWFSYRRADRGPAILVKKALVVGEISLNEFRVIYRHEEPVVDDNGIDDPFSEVSCNYLMSF